VRTWAQLMQGTHPMLPPTKVTIPATASKAEVLRIMEREFANTLRLKGLVVVDVLPGVAGAENEGHANAAAADLPTVEALHSLLKRATRLAPLRVTIAPSGLATPTDTDFTATAAEPLTKLTCTATASTRQSEPSHSVQNPAESDSPLQTPLLTSPAATAVRDVASGPRPTTAPMRADGTSAELNVHGLTESAVHLVSASGGVPTPAVAPSLQQATSLTPRSHAPSPPPPPPTLPAVLAYRAESSSALTAVLELPGHTPWPEPSTLTHGTAASTPSQSVTTSPEPGNHGRKRDWRQADGHVDSALLPTGSDHRHELGRATKPVLSTSSKFVSSASILAVALARPAPSDDCVAPMTRWDSAALQSSEPERGRGRGETVRRKTDALERYIQNLTQQLETVSSRYDEVKTLLGGKVDAEKTLRDALDSDILTFVERHSGS
jgi:hypothetical protein